MPNRLIDETSPYLQQHAHNPVDWYPWGDEALRKARAEDKPILLSIGYSACHWCHVMERESFENESIAGLMNDNFVSIKVDREERPDLDTIYMEAVQALSGQGGWPMTVFLTPDGVPFWGGTYFPPTDRGGMPGFPRVLVSLAAAYRTKHDDVVEQATALRAQLGRSLLGFEATGIDAAVADRAYAGLSETFDARNGGFGAAPKFPQPMNMEFLLRYHHRTGKANALSMTRTTLDRMAAGGIYDQLGGGFHRYATDAVWLVPHFEKMLYDNALLSRVYLEAYQATGDDAYRTVVEETLDYVVREMTAPQGGFYTAQDADSEGEEGKFFVWTPREIAEIVGEADAPLVSAYYGVTAGGNFEGTSILYRPQPLDAVAAKLGVSAARLRDAVERARPLLLASRETRIHPQRDEKMLTAWNGLMLRAFAEAGRALDRLDYTAAASRSAAFLLSTMEHDGRLRRTYREGQEGARLNGYLEDYAALAAGLLALYESTYEPHLFAAARRLTDTMLAHFWDDAEGGFFNTSDDHEELISRPRDLFDNAVPSGNSMAVEVLLRLSALGGDQSYAEKAETTLKALSGLAARAPGGFGRLLSALELVLAGTTEVAVVGGADEAETAALLHVLHHRYLPTAGAGVALLEGRTLLDGHAAAYVCRHFACRRPVTTPAELEEELAR